MQKYMLFKDYKLHLVILIATIIAELIGTQKLTLGIFTFSLAPLIFSMLLVATFYLLPFQKVVTKKHAKSASTMMAIIGGILIAKLSVSSGAAINQVLGAGVAVIVQNFGEGLAFLFALPVAIILGLKREAVGITFGVSREANVALITDKYSSDSPEFRGVMTNYIVGTIFGVIAVSLVMSVLAEAPFVSPESLALATGVGSASMMVGGLGTLLERFPEKAVELEAYAAMSNLISTVMTIYIALFIGLPLTERAYRVLDKFRK